MWSNRFTEKASSIVLISPRLQALRSHGNGFTPSAILSTKFLIVLAVLVFVWISNALIAGDLFSGSTSAAIAASQEEDGDPVRNSTLGFHKLYALSLPDHEERRRPLLAAANATNLTLTVLDAVYDVEIPDAEKPPRWNASVSNEGELGCLMSHRLTWRKMIDENIQSAIIIESDADWDMRIGPSMQGLSNGVKAIMDWPFNNADYPVNPYTNHSQSTEKRPTGDSPSSSSSSLPEKEHPLHRGRRSSTPPSSPSSRSPESEPPLAPLPLSNYFTDIPLTPTPYGANWDILWLGHCGSTNGRNHRTYLYGDGTAAPHAHAWTWTGGPDSDVHRPGSSRLVYEPVFVACTTAYAVSRSGARKLDRLFELTTAPVDLAMADWCAHRVDLRCVSVFPQIMSPAHARSTISGRLDGGNAEELREVSGAGKGIQVSARRNAAEGLAGEGEEGWVREWEDSEEDWREGEVYGPLGAHG